MKIKSVSDVITNSSSEVFVVRLSDPLYQELKKIVKWEEYPDLDSVKDVVLSDSYYYWEDKYGGENIVNINDCPEEFPEYDVFRSLPKTQENWEKYKDFYQGITGKAYLQIDRDSIECREVRDRVFQDYVEKEILPIIKTLIPGKTYHGTLKRDKTIELSFVYGEEITVEGPKFSPFQTNIVTLLTLIDLHEN